MRHTCSLICIALLALTMFVGGNPPAWWQEGNQPVIDPAASPNNHGPAIIGQAKNMAKSALAALSSILPQVATDIESDLVGPGKPIPDWNPPADQAARDKNHAPLLTGQLKAIAHPFYVHLHAAAPAWLAEQRAANGTESGGIFPWTDASSDDNHHGMANIGQLKAAFSLHFTHDTDGDSLTDLFEHTFGTDPNKAMTYPGIPDSWLAQNFPTGNGFEPYGDPDGDDIDNALENQLGLDPNSFDKTGPVNFGFDEEITESPELSFRETTYPYPSDLYDHTSIPGYSYSNGQTEGWQADTGSHIEIWDESIPLASSQQQSGGGQQSSPPQPTTLASPYVELQSHLGGHGVKQEFNMVPGSRMNFILRYKGRYEYDAYDNAFDLKVEGASELLVDGSPVTAQGSTRTKAFMDEDDWDKYVEWHYATVALTAETGGTGLKSITLSLVPKNTTRPGENGEEEITYGGFVDLIPVDSAPEVLAVNSDFDEGRIDSETGYAIPDCDDVDIALEAERDHLDGKYEASERIVDDMHPGFFGVAPTAFDNDFWAGADVTIRKIDKTDPATGHPESGHVRLYGKWGDGPSEYRAITPYDFDTLSAVNLATGGINGAAGESVYGETSPFPEGTSYYIEGVHPGKITLEWRYQKSGLDLKYEQSFEVCTHKNALQWKHELAYKIRLETSNDPSGEINTIAIMLPGESYRDRMERASEYYDFYQDCFLTPLRSKPLPPQAMTWPGLARLAGSQVIGGLSDAEYARMLLELGSIPGYVLPQTIQDDLTQWSLSETKDLQQALFTGARTIFQSIGWQMHAYRSSGYRALDWVETETQETEVTALSGVWKNLRKGILNHEETTLNQVALDITRREQNVTIVPTWNVISGLFGGTADWMFSVLGENSCSPSGKDFREIFPQFPVSTGSLANTADRWTWIQPSTADGILDTWNKHPISSRDALVRKTLEQDARRFSRVHQIAYQFPTYLYLPIWIWDNEDVP